MNKKSPIRIFFIFPIIIFAIIALLQLLLGDVFYFALWSFVFVVITVICLPIIIPPQEERYVPIYQIFSIFITFIFISSVVTFFDISNYLPSNKALIISVFAGSAITGLILFLRGNGK